ncbi:hypothetical protein AB835_00740 [Candidatus Endobugula sertula]|uniref:P/Homo B domain-containing protein n=1 Tax=Candidatus Endobugula sertula TaxID=62101 RepID=A0A1D2QU02_9GAMM|nr:hypothetical protein AB835_00740 [Candidatus Endobugula sertula]
MPNLNIEQLSDLLSTSVASYGALSKDRLAQNLYSEDQGAGFSIIQSENFSEKYKLLNQQENTASGFSATVFEDQTTGKKILAIRGTEILTDIVNDLVVADILGIGGKGYANSQAIDLYRYITQLHTPKDEAITYTPSELVSLYSLQHGAEFAENSYKTLQHLHEFQQFAAELTVDYGLGLLDFETIDVTGHSLGGHLGYMAGRFFPQLVDNIVTLNAPGFYERGDELLTDLGFASLDNERITAINAEGDVVSQLGSIHPGTTINIAQEVGEAGYDSVVANHSSVNGLDALNLMSVLARLDTSLSNDPAGLLSHLISSSTYEEERHYEILLDQVRYIVLGNHVDATPIGDREAFYRHMDELIHSSEFQTLEGKIQLTEGPKTPPFSTEDSNTTNIYASVYGEDNVIALDTFGDASFQWIDKSDGFLLDLIDKERSELQSIVDFIKEHHNETYTIQSGDSISAIAKDLGMTTQELVDANLWLQGDPENGIASRISDDGQFILIKPGETLTIPDDKKTLASLQYETDANDNIIYITRGNDGVDSESTEGSRTVDVVKKDASASLVAALEENNGLSTEQNAHNWFQTVGNTFSGWVDNTADFIVDVASGIGNILSGTFSTMTGWVSGLLNHNDSSTDQSLADNSRLDLEIRTDLEFDFEQRQEESGGNVVGDADWEARMSTINDDGMANTEPGKIVSDGHRPGNHELVDDALSDAMDRNTVRITQQQEQPQQDSGFFESVGHAVGSAVSTIGNVITGAVSAVGNFFSSVLNNTGLFGGREEVVNVDPLAVDLNGDGTHYNDSHAVFDVDNDGYAENTGWIHRSDGIVVHDVDGDGKINDITETISEFYGSEKGTGQNEQFADGLDALASLDSNNDGVFDANDEMFSTLRVWQDNNGDAKTDAGELSTLTEVGIASIDLNKTISDRERLEGNVVLSRSTYQTATGETREVAAVDFATNSIGYEWNDVADGLEIHTEDGKSSSFVVDSTEGKTVDLAEKGVNSAYGNVGDDTLIGDENDNWLIGGAGSDTLKGGAGNDLLGIDANDKQENIDGGEGVDIARIISDEGVSLNLAATNIEVANGGAGNDVLVGGGNANVFISGGDGNDVIIGGHADDALSGENGDDFIDGSYGDDVIRGHKGSDVLIGNEGNDYLDGGLEDDALKGGAGKDILIGGAGNDLLDGAEGFDVVKYSESYANFDIQKTAEGFEVTHSDTGDKDTLTGIEKIRFSDFDLDLTETNFAPTPVRDKIDYDGSQKTFTITAAQLLNNDKDIDGDALTITNVLNAIGGTATLNDDGSVIFSVKDGFMGVASFDYEIEDEHGIQAEVSVRGDQSGQTATMRASVQLRDSNNPEDELFYDQWYLHEINVKGAWEDYSGKGISIGVFEEGAINYTHHDLDDNITKDHKKTLEFNEVENFSNHKTTVAGVIAAERNGEGAVGVAYDATLEGHSWDSEGLSHMKGYDIANNSWGFADSFADNVLYNQKAIDFTAHIEEAVKEGRDGLGTAVVFAGGNDRQTGGNSNYHNLQNSTNVIATGSINKAGDLGKLQQASDPFSSPCANILVSAPGSDINTTANLLTNDNGSTFGSEYESAQGTSFSAPIISGVIALMLEANPELGYRDIQKILAYSAKKVEDANTDWQTNSADDWNGGGLHTSHDYGFGNIDAYTAVRLAETWNTQNTDKNVSYKLVGGNAVNQQVADGSTVDITIEVTDQISIEHVELRLDIDHKNVSDLTITLISPDGTRSIMVDKPYVDTDGNQLTPSQIADYVGGKDFIDFIFSSTNHYGETSQGTWTLRIEDTHGNHIGGVLNSYKLGLKGSEEGGSDTYIYTGEFGSLTETERLVLSDDDGGIDTINTAGIFTNTVIDLNAGEISHIAGKEVLIAGATKDAKYDELKSSIAVKEETLLEKQNNLTQKQQALQSKQEEYTNINSRIGEKYNQYTDKKAEYDAAVSLVNQKQEWFDNHTYLSSFKVGATYHVYKNNTTGKIVDLSGDELEKKTNEYNNAVSDYQQKQTELNMIIGEYGHLLTRKDELPSEIATLETEVSDLSSQINQIEPELNFAKEYVELVDNGKASTIENATTGDGNDIVIGNTLNNIINAGRGNDNITTGEGNDIVIVKVKAGDHDVIKDFDTAQDKIDLGESVDSFSDLILAQQDNHTLITFANGYSITLENTLVSDINSSHFLIGKTNYIFGSANDDIISGSDDSDVIKGGAGDDIIIGNDDDDILDGGAGNDTILGGEGDDTATGGEGNDTLLGGDGNDTLSGDAGDDHVQGDAGDDQLAGGTANDTLLGGSGNDTAMGGEGDDFIDTGAGDDVAEGGAGDDWLQDTGGGDDQFNGGTGDDTLLGGDGNDTLSGDAADDHVQGDEGDDQLDGGQGNDTLLGEGGNDTISGGDGDDHLQGDNWRGIDSGSDLLNGGAGNDTLLGGAGSDHLFGDDGDDIVLGGNDHDIISGGNGKDWLQGDRGNDVANGGAGDDIILGGYGHDTLDGKAGDDWVQGDAGDDILNGSDGEDILLGEGGNDILRGGDGDDHVQGDNWANRDAGDDTLYGDAGNDVILGGDNNDKLYGGKGNDYLVGGNGSDTMHGGEGDDVIIDQAFFDRGTNINELYGEAGNDFLQGSKGDDVLSGGAGNNIIHVKNAWRAGSNDVVVITKNTGGSDTLISFDVNQDKIDLTDFGSDLKNITVTGLSNNSDSGSIIELGDSQRILIQGVSSSKITKELFMTHNSEKIDIIRPKDTYEALDSELVNALFKGGEFIIRGKNEESTLVGGDNNDLLSGGKKDDILIANNGDDILHGGDGDNKLDGGAGSDTYIIDGTWNTTVIESYEAGKDTIDLSLLYDISEIKLSKNKKTFAKEKDGNIVFYFEENIILIKDTTYKNINFDDFIGINESDVTREEYRSVVAEDINISVGFGNNFIEGTGTHDAFSLTKKYWGTDVITNFDTTTSRVDVSSWMSKEDTIYDLNISGVDGDTVITFGSDSYQKLVLQGVNPDNLSATNFQFDRSHVMGNENDNVITANGNVKIIDGGDGDDVLTGGKSTKTINGGDGNDIISSKGWAEGSILTGGNGNDIFIVNEDFFKSINIITDFNPIEDKIDLSVIVNSQHFDISKLSDLKIIQNGDDVVIEINRTHNKSKIILQNVDGNYLDTKNFTGIDIDVDIVKINDPEVIGDASSSQGQMLYDDEYNNVIAGGSGNDIIHLNDGDNTINNGEGSDIFIIDRSSSGVDTITDFDVTQDKLDLTQFTEKSYSRIKDFSDLNVAQEGLDTKIIIDHHTVILKDMTSTDLTGANFEGVTDTSAITEDQVLSTNRYDATLIGGSGNNTLSGGQGRDVFVIDDSSSGIDTITDFDITQDKLDLTQFTEKSYSRIKDFSDLSVTQDGVDTKIIIDHHTVILKDMTSTDLTGANFLGVTDTSAITEDQVLSTNRYDATLIGGSGNDSITGYYGNDTLQGGSGNDSLHGEGGADSLFGGEGDDIISGGAGDNTLSGGQGSDVFVIDDSSFYTDTITDFDVVTDKLDLTQFTEQFYSTIKYFSDIDISQYESDTKIVINNHSIILKNIVASSLTIDNFIGITDKLSMTEDQTIIGNFDDNNLVGGLGNDTINGGYGGNDQLTGNVGSDAFIIEQKYAWDGSVITDTITDFTIKEDKIDLTKIWNVTDYDSLKMTESESDVIIHLTDSHQLILQNTNKGQISEDDFILRYKSNSVIDGTDSKDFLTLYGDNNIINAKDGNDNISFTGNGNVVNGGKGDDRIETWSGSDNTLNGGDGDDYLETLSGNYQTLNGGTGNDTLYTLADSTTLSGGKGSDTFEIWHGFSSGKTTIADFTKGDLIDLSKFQVSSIAELNMSQQGNDTLITITRSKSNGITLENTGLSDWLDFFSSVGLDDSFDGIIELSKDNNNLIVTTDDVQAAILENTKLSDVVSQDIVNLYGRDNLDSLNLVTISNDENNGLLIETTTIINHEITLSNVNMTDLEESDFYLRIDGTDGDDVLTGSDRDDYINGKSGDDIIDSGEGSDKLTGGEGSDTFVIKNITPGSFSQKTIEDFQIDYDKLDFSQFDTINSQADFEMNAFERNLWEKGEDGSWHETDETIINVRSADSGIQITGASLEEFTENNFIFE